MFKDFSIYHAYIVTSDGIAPQQYFRGGPNSVSDPSNPIFGNITTAYGAYVPGTKDHTTGTEPTSVILDDGKPCDCYNSSFSKTLDGIKDADIGYIPYRSNSNSVVNTALLGAGFNHSPPVIAPAFSTDLSRYLGRYRRGFP